MIHIAKIILTFALFFLHACGFAQMDRESDLFRTISEMDSVFFKAYNDCNLKKQSDILSEDLEFYHDKGGLSTSKNDVMAALERNICGKVTRELVKGSIEVHEIPGFGAVEMGMHKFHNSQEPDAISRASKFITIWKHEENNWKITRVISLH